MRDLSNSPNCPRCKSENLFLPAKYFARNVVESFGYMREKDFPHCTKCNLDLKGYFPWLPDHIRQNQLSNWNSYLQKRVSDGWTLDKDWSPKSLNCFWALDFSNLGKMAIGNYMNATMMLSGEVFEYRGFLPEKRSKFVLSTVVGGLIGALCAIAFQKALNIEFSSWAGIAILVITLGFARYLVQKINKNF